MSKEKTVVRGIRSKHWEALQQQADENENGNLNHLVNKIFFSFLKALGKKKK